MSQVPNCEALTYTAAPGSTNLQVLVQEKWVVVVRVLADPPGAKPRGRLSRPATQRVPVQPWGHRSNVPSSRLREPG
jgi:hypothetical protein